MGQSGCELWNLENPLCKKEKEKEKEK